MLTARSNRAIPSFEDRERKQRLEQTALAHIATFNELRQRGASTSDQIDALTSASRAMMDIIRLNEALQYPNDNTPGWIRKLELTVDYMNALGELRDRQNRAATTTATTSR